MNQKENDDFLRIINLRKSFGDLHVLNGVNLNIKHRERLIIIGPSGGGKSTLLRCIMGLERIDEGEILVENEPYIVCGQKKEKHSYLRL